MLDPTSLSSLTIEAEYVSMAEKDDESQWEEKPLFELRQKFSTPEAARFLEKNILEKQTGRAHPQDPAGLNQEMRLYWVFREGNETTRNKTSVGTRLKATSEVPNNRAAMNALADGLTFEATTFHTGKGGDSQREQQEIKGKGGDNRKGGGKNKGKGKAKGKQAGSSRFFFAFTTQRTRSLLNRIGVAANPTCSNSNPLLG